MPVLGGLVCSFAVWTPLGPFFFMEEPLGHGIGFAVLSPTGWWKLNGLALNSPYFNMALRLPGLFHCSSAILGRKKPWSYLKFSLPRHPLLPFLWSMLPSLSSIQEGGPGGPFSLIPKSICGFCGFSTPHGAWPRQEGRSQGSSFSVLTSSQPYSLHSWLLFHCWNLYQDWVESTLTFIWKK